METVQLKCGHCKKVMAIGVEHLGGQVRCPHCKGVVQTPPRSQDEAPPVAGKADAFDRRIVTLLAFGPAAMTVVVSAVSGRGAIAMWGYPLWLFLGLWIVLYARTALAPARLRRIAAAWASVFALFAIVFAASYSPCGKATAVLKLLRPDRFQFQGFSEKSSKA